MSISRLLALGVTSAVMPAVMMLVAVLPCATTLNVSWVILAIAPTGVIDVSPVEVTAISVNTNTSGIASSPERDVNAEEEVRGGDHRRAHDRDADDEHPHRQLDVGQRVGVAALRARGRTCR